jgi:hypothetical protein
MEMNKRMMLSSVVGVVGVVLVASLLVRGETQTTQLPRFQIEIHAAGEKGPSFTITNLTGKTITACVVELSTSTDPEQKQKTLWDALVQGQLPIEPGANLSQYLGHPVGDPLPNKVEVIAGVWEDGETFGQAVWVQQILKNREKLAAAYEQAIAVLQQGLERNWTGEQYLAAFVNKPNSGPVYAIHRTLEANAKPGHDAQSLPMAMRSLLAYFTRNLAVIRQAKRTGGVATKPPRVPVSTSKG